MGSAKWAVRSDTATTTTSTTTTTTNTTTATTTTTKATATTTATHPCEYRIESGLPLTLAACASQLALPPASGVLGELMMW